MAFPNEEARDATLSYALAEYGNGITVDDLAQIVFTRVDDGKLSIEKALQYGEDVTSRARFAEEKEK
jgi:polyhydroxyalkanoate synthesis regulator phasin